MIDVCFWCYRPKEEGQEGNPTLNDYEPCKECNKKWNKGILVVEVSTESNGNPPIVDELFPTGLWVVISEQDVKKVLTDYPALDKILESKTMYLNENDWKKLLL